MTVEQFYDEGLAHASYGLVNQGVVAVVDPGRDPQPYLDFVERHQAKLVAIIETHPHADFVSSHRELAQRTGATIYVSGMVGADYPHQAFDEGDSIVLGDATLHALNTPGHSPDSLSIVLRNAQGQDHAVFTGDTLFIGDVGRPDLREAAGNLRAQRADLARQMYHSTRQKLMTLAPEVWVYPAHGAGSLCGKNLSSETVSTIGEQLADNYALQPMSEAAFVEVLLDGQPFIPKYFGYDVDLNRQGAPDFEASVQAVPRLAPDAALDPDGLVIDTRPQVQFRAGHLPGAINLMNGGKFETWLGSIVGPEERFYLIAEDEAVLETMIRKAAKIGYEQHIVGALLAPETQLVTEPALDLDQVRQHPEQLTIVDIRNESEFAAGAFFDQAINIPLSVLRERSHEIPTDRPILVHCAGGYRSAAGSSIVAAALGDQTPVYDLSEAVKEFDPAFEKAH
jgi:glyoxylase-like metal-dependent hydrolase (beta-lactamase superfamily II)/rhodanese-related sulfurtransferase